VRRIKQYKTAMAAEKWLKYMNKMEAGTR